MIVRIDDREKKSRIKSAQKFFESSGYSTSVETLVTGDYVFHDRIAFEYKSEKDMIESIKKGRVFRQAKNMQQYEYSYVIVVGNVAEEINNQNQKKYRYTRKKYDNKGKFTVKAYLGALARLTTYSHVLTVDNDQQAWRLMDLLVSKILADNVDVKMVERPQNGLTNPIASFLSCIYINESQRLPVKSALKIVDELGLNTLSDLLNVDYSDLVKISGIGDKSAQAVIETIR